VKHNESKETELQTGLVAFIVCWYYCVQWYYETEWPELMVS